jgi:hypothetical protein
MKNSIDNYDKIQDERELLGSHINEMQKNEFEELVEVLNLTKSQKNNIEELLYRIDKDIKRGMVHENKAILFTVPKDVCGELWFTVRSETLNNTLLCLTDNWYNIRLGKRGKVEFTRSSIGSSDKKRYDSFNYLNF